MPDVADSLVATLCHALEPVLGDGVEISDVTRLSGGASRHTWSFLATRPDGTRERLILRRDHAGAPPSALDLEAAVLQAASRVGVPVPDVLTSGTMTDGDGGAQHAPFLIMRFVDGETIPRRVLQDEALAGAREILAAQCGTVLATIHAMAPTDVPGLAGGDPLEQMRGLLDRLGQPHPALELGLRWLAEHRPPRRVPTVVHGDFRNGNLIIGPEGIRAVIDWELSHVGDPLEDLGWLCVKAWRFGSKLPVGGFGTTDQLVDAYEAAGGVPVDRDELLWWEMFGTLRWGVICIVQVVTHTSGALRSVELAAIGRRVCEVEWDLLAMMP